MKKAFIVIALVLAFVATLFAVKPPSEPSPSKKIEHKEKTSKIDAPSVKNYNEAHKSINIASEQENLNEAKESGESSSPLEPKEKRPPRSGDEIQEIFNKEQIIDSDWEYRNEQNLYTLINNRVYVGDVKTLNNLDVECKSTICMISGDGQEKIDIAPFLESLSEQLKIDNIDWDIVQMNIVDGKIKVAIYPKR